MTRDACELFDKQAVVPPKRRRAVAEGLIARGHLARSACRIAGLARPLLQYHRRRPVPDREVRRLIVADTITEIHQRYRGAYGRRRMRAALLADCDMNVNHKLVNSIMSEHGLYGLPRPGRRKPNLIGVDTPVDLANRRFAATTPNELGCVVADGGLVLGGVDSDRESCAAGAGEPFQEIDRRGARTGLDSRDRRLGGAHAPC